MKVEIWSDVMCPFCYIGKRRFEAALANFPGKQTIELEWKSYQLMPDIKTQPGKSIDQVLSESKGIPMAEAHRMNTYVTEMAAKVGLVYNFDKSVVANSFNAHRFSHFAKQSGKQDAAEEKLFAGYFTEGKNIDDTATLVQMGAEIGLDADALKTALENNAFAENVIADVREAQMLGVRGVPFFVFDRKYAVSGAQEAAVFTDVLEKSYAEWSDSQKELKMEVIEGDVCGPDGIC